MCDLRRRRRNTSHRVNAGRRDRIVSDCSKAPDSSKATVTQRGVVALLPDMFRSVRSRKSTQKMPCSSMGTGVVLTEEHALTCPKWRGSPKVTISRTAERSTVAKKKMPPFLTLNIRTFRKSGYCYAECLTLSLIARRADESSALQALFEQIALYLHDAREFGDWGQVVPRPASWSRWFWYYIDVVAGPVMSHLRHAVQHATYIIPVDQSGHVIGTSASAVPSSNPAQGDSHLD